MSNFVIFVELDQNDRVIFAEHSDLSDVFEKYLIGEVNKNELVNFLGVYSNWDSREYLTPFRYLVITELGEYSDAFISEVKQKLRKCKLDKIL